MSPEEIVEAQVRMFWCSAARLREAARNGEPAEVVHELLDELEVLGLNADQSRLRERCKDILDHAKAACPDCSFFSEHRDSMPAALAALGVGWSLAWALRDVIGLMA